MRIGPQIPDNLKRKVETQELAEEELYGPSLPPELMPSTSHITVHENQNSLSIDNDQEIGPELPTNDLQEFQEFSNNLITFEERKKRENDNVEKREEWMTSLPSKYQTYGLGPRQFSKKITEEKDDGSTWTKKPNEIASICKQTSTKDKNQEGKQKRKYNEKLDEAYNLRVEKFNKEKNRQESLLDLHSKKRRIEEKQEDKKERRPFDREQDLKIFDPSKSNSTESLAEKARNLASKFNHGRDKKFL